MAARQYFVYILSNKSRTLYTGVTNALMARVHQHKAGQVEGFTRRYHVTQLVYFESCGEVLDAIAREKQIKGWRRSKKIALIESLNPQWIDLYEAEAGPDPSRSLS